MKRRSLATGRSHGTVGEHRRSPAMPSPRTAEQTSSTERAAPRPTRPSGGPAPFARSTPSSSSSSSARPGGGDRRPTPQGVVVDLEARRRRLNGVERHDLLVHRDPSARRGRAEPDDQVARRRRMLTDGSDRRGPAAGRGEPRNPSEPRDARRPGAHRRGGNRVTARGPAGRVLTGTRAAAHGLGRTIAWFQRSQPTSSSSVWKAGRPRRRLLAVVAVIAVVFAAIIARVALLQTGGGTFAAFGAEQRTRDQVITADRGVIFDRHGNELVITVPATTIYANPKLVVNPEATAMAIANVLHLSPERQQALARDLAKPKDFVYVARAIDDSAAKSVAALQLKGIGWYDEPTRLFPSGSVARSIVGRANVDGVGTAGLEKQYDALLRGTNGSVLREVDGEGRSIPTGRRALVNPIPGQDLILTISRPLQYQAEQALIEQVNAIGARGATAIVIGTKSGEMYALANVERNENTGVVEVTSKNVAAVDANEPGSVAKVITLAAAVNEGTVDRNTFFQVPGYLEFDDIVLKDAHPHGTEDYNVEKILGVSSNIGTYRVMQTIGVHRHEEYLRAFGLGKATALGFPGEQSGIVHDADNYQGTEAVTVAWGQGVSATALQLVAAVNVIANRGQYVDPKLVRAVIDASGNTIDTPASPTRPVISPEAAAEMAAMMQTVVCKGTGKEAKVEGYDIAGKTGTSYKAQPNGTYRDENGHFVYFASFVGFFPADDPQVTVLVSIDEPPAGGSRYGGTVAAPVFAEIARATINQLRIPPPLSGGCGE